jgi:hypothetical protein
VLLLRIELDNKLVTGHTLPRFARRLAASKLALG